MARTPARWPRSCDRAARSAIARPRSGGRRQSVRVAGGYSPRRRPAPGGAVRATAILRDISAVRALEELREGFVATVSHELRTPLALVRGYAETLLHFELDAGPAARLHRADPRADRAPRVARRPDPRRDPSRRRSTDPRAGPDRVRRPRRRGCAATSRRPATTPGSSSELPDGPAADRGRRGPRRPGAREPRRQRPQVRAAGRALVRRRRAVDGEWLAVASTTRASGSRRRNGRSSLEPFHRAWNVRESRIPGTGLGLSISRRLVEAHGGRLGSSDRPDGRPGTRVTFTLPLAAPGRASRAAEPGRPRPPRLEAEPVAERILIVEDEPEFAALLELWMGRAGLRAGPRGDRHRRPAAVLRDAPGPRHPRCGAARSRRLAGHRADPRVQPGPDPHGHRAQLRGRQGPRPEAGRGRLHHEAAQPAGARSRGSRPRCGGRRPRRPSGPAGSSTATSSSTSTSTVPGSAARRSG